MTAPELRPYQRETIDAVIAARRRGVRRMVVCLPTGAGKTVIFSRLARLATRQVLECSGQLMRFAKESGTAVIVVGHVTKGGGIAGP
ncbi:MAG: DEAD/DEAH box helicase family protein, partial [Myxococcales bacterium]|nr:DEAD/DEAH box helicase family protein [Myxococcales bacterium]